MNKKFPPIIENLDKPIDASFLVFKYMELLNIIPYRSYWNEEYLINNPPAYYRLLQFQCLCKIYNLGSVKEFINGDFILSRNQEEKKYRIHKYQENLFYLEYFINIKNAKIRLGINEKEVQKTEVIVSYAIQSLSEMISPKNEVFILKDLLEKYGYPNVDVYVLDKLY
jgi:hypothetical protein